MTATRPHTSGPSSTAWSILAGGLSHERDVSLRSGRRVADAMRDAGLEVTVRDVDAGLMQWLRSEKPDCVIPLLHGEAGEDGALREVLDLPASRTSASTPAAARVAFDKPIAKQVVAGRPACVRRRRSRCLPTRFARSVPRPSWKR